MNVDQKLLTRVEKYRFKRMFPTRTEAIEALLEAGLGAEPHQSPADPDFENRFASLSRQWREDTKFASSVSAAAMHPAYQEMIGMGERALPLIFRELASEPDNPGHWFWALRAITGTDPVAEEQKGVLRLMAAAWLTWAAEHGYR
jgi:hypothetical protein